MKLILSSLLSSVMALPVLAATISFDPSPLEGIGSDEVRQTVSDARASAASTAATNNVTLAALGAVQTHRGKLATSVGVIGEIANGLKNVATAYDLSQASSVEEIADYFSTVDISSALSAARQVGKASSSARAKIEELKVDIPTADVYLAVAIDETARSEAKNALSTLRNLKSSDTVSDLNKSLEDFRAYESEVDAATTRVFEASEKLAQISSEASSVPLSKTLLEASVSLELDAQKLSSLSSEVATARSKLEGYITALDNKKELDDAISTYEVALETPLAKAEWTTELNVLAPGMGNNFAIRTAGSSFSTKGIFTEGNFLVGGLTVSNLDGTVGQDTGTLEATITRSINIAGLDPIISTATASSDFRYVTTPFNENPRLSADAVFLKALGKSATVFEGATASFFLEGAINSPFRLVDIFLAPGETDGFVTTDPFFIPDDEVVAPIPLPAGGPMLAAALFLILRFKSRSVCR